MNISAKTDYAVRAMLALTTAASQGHLVVAADTLAEDQGLPRKFLEAILSDLRRGGLVISSRGSSGGYALARPAWEITLGDVFRAVAGPLAEVRGLRPHETQYTGSAEHLPTVWVAVRSALRQVLDDTTLDQVARGDLPEAVVALSDDPEDWQSR